MWVYVMLAAVFTAGVTANKEETVGGITTKVLGQSGKIQVYREGQNASSGVTITMSAIRERQSDDSEINSHNFNTFATQSFNFSSSEETTYPDSDVNVTQFSFESTVDVGKGQTKDGTAKVKSYIYIFSSDGNITVDGDSQTVSAGVMKFNIEIQDWPFCGAGAVTCAQGATAQVGATLDFEVEIKGQGNTTSVAGDSKTYDVGGATVIVPVQVTYFKNDGSNETKNMPAGFPKLDTTGSKSTFTFRFEKFEKRVLYDPTVDVAADGGDGGSGTTPAPSQDTTVTEGVVTAKVLGRSGKMAISNNDGKSVTVEFDNLKEKDSAGADIKDNAHGYNNFASQDFTFSPITDVDYPDSTLGTKKIEFNATVTNGAKLMVDMYIFKEDGNITMDGETTVVKKGDVKFTVDIMGWKFCGDQGVTCSQQAGIGAFLDFDIVIKGSKAPTKTTSGAGNPEGYDLGSGHVFLSKKIKVDSGAWQNMTSGYPMATTQGSKQIFRVRFPKFTNSVFYDPSISLSTEPSGSTGVVASLVTLFACALALFL